MKNKPNKNVIAVEMSPTEMLALVSTSYKRFEQNCEEKWGNTGKEFVRLLVNKRDALYTTFEVPKKNSQKTRLITAPSEILKTVQTGLAAFVGEQYNPHQNSHGFEPGKSTRTAAETMNAVPNKWERQVTNIDIKGAFPAIEGRAIRSLLRHDSKIVLTPWQVNILAKIATGENDRLSTGSPSSPAIFNWRLTKFDNELEKAMAKRNWYWVRYADDVTVSHYQTQKAEVVQLLIRMLKPLGLEIERKKLKTFKAGYAIILGLIVHNDDRIRISRHARRKMRGLAHRFTHLLGKARNSYTHKQAGKMRRKLPEQWAVLKGSVTATLCGYAAYLIGIDRPLNTKRKASFVS
jgi:hypothetical protein